VIQELQITPMGVITMIHPQNNDMDTRIGINLFKQVRQLCPWLKQLMCSCVSKMRLLKQLCAPGHAVVWHACCTPDIAR
jgi:hypothetical protein